MTSALVLVCYGNEPDQIELLASASGGPLTVSRGQVDQGADLAVIAATPA